jgi:hypothetical protein
VDNEFRQLAQWIRDGIAPVSGRFRDYILPKLENTDAGTLQYSQGKAASAYHNEIIEKRLRRPSGSKRKLFIRTAESPFDGYGRLLAYIAPSYTIKELKTLTRRERATFNLNMIESGWAAPFVLFPVIPGELDLPLFLEMAVKAKQTRSGQYQDELSLPGYEYRMCEKLYRITKKLSDGMELLYRDRKSWRSRYCADMRDRKLYGPEDYMAIDEPYRLWIWPDDLQNAIGILNLVPAG